MKPLPLLCLFGVLTILRAQGQIQLRGHNTEREDDFGEEVAVSGDTLVVGARQEDGGGTGVNPPSDEAAADSGAAYVFVNRGGVWAQQAYLKASNTDAGDQFGRSVAIDGDTIVVGARAEASRGMGGNPQADNSSPQNGAAYVFVREDSVWRQQGYLKKAPGFPQAVRFGTSVAISGNTVIVGESDFFSSGGASIFVRKDGLWTLQASLTAAPLTGGRFGGCVAVSGDFAAVGAETDGYGEGVNPGGSPRFGVSGAVYLYARSGTSWTLMNRLKMPGFAFFDRFGTSVALSGETLAASAISTGKSSEGQADPVPSVGAVFIYSVKAGQWLPETRVEAEDSRANLYFGSSVALSGDRLAVGAVGKNVAAGEDADGSFYAFSFRDGTWSQESRLGPRGIHPSLYFGRTVSLSGETLVAGPGTYGALPSDGEPPAPVNIYDWNRITAAPDPGGEDSDGDGMPDFMERYFGTAVGTPEAAPLSVDITDGMLRMTWPEAEADGVVVTPEWSPDLLTWLAGGEAAEGIAPVEIQTALTGPGQRRASAQVSGRARMWMRLRVTRPAPVRP